MSVFSKTTPPCRQSTGGPLYYTAIVLCFITVVTVFSNNNVLGNSIIESKCDATLFPKPYIILRESRNGPEVSRLETQGVLDLRNEIKRYICINGPVVIYMEASVEEDSIDAPSPISPSVTTTVTGETIKFSNGTFRIFNHKCMTINRLPKFELNKLKGLAIPPHVDSSVEVIGMKAMGIFLVASEQAYDPTFVLKVMLNQVGLGYATGPSEAVISDASFIAVGKGPYCLKLKDGSTVVLSSPAVDDNEICRWSLKDDEFPNKDYRRAFQKEVEKTEYKWEDCPPDIMNTAPTADPAKVPGTGGRFSMLNPANVAPHGSRRGGKLSGGDDWPPADLDDSQMTLNNSCSVNPGDPACDQEPDFPTAEDEEPDDPSAPPTNIFLTLTNCEQLPKFDAADPICELLKKTDPTFDKLTVALELEEDPAATVKILTLQSTESLKWKDEVLQILANIFSKICPPIRRQSVFQLMRVINNYIATAHTADPEASEYSNLVNKSYTWEILMSRLKRCEESYFIVPMEWEWTISNNRKKREVLFDSFDDLLGQLETGDTRPKPIIARSSPVFSNNQDNDHQKDFVFANIPRWKRTSPSPLDDILLPWIQEYFPPSSADNDNTVKHQTFMLHPEPESLRIKDYPDEEIFYYEDLVEVELNLNPAIDAWWKISASVLGYCQINEKSRENEIFPTLLHNFDEYFLQPIKDKWTNAEGELTELEMVLGEFLDPDRARWLDTCLETSYIVTDSLHFRPARPLYFENSTGALEANRFIETPENYEDQDSQDGSSLAPKYFTKKKILVK